MLHLLPDRFKRLFTLQMIVLMTFIIVGFLTFPFILVAYFTCYKTHRKLYRAIVNRLCYFTWIHFTYIAQWWGGLRIKLYSDEKSISHVGKEHALIIMNHKYDIDWVSTWIFAERFGVLGGGQSFAKRSLKHVPIIGWIWQFNGTIFLNRDWNKDKEVIAENLKGFSDTMKGYYHVLLLYPEGTRFTKKKLEASNEIARSKGMPELKHCLLPRSKGFVEVIKNMRSQIDVIYNVTIAFPDSINPDVKGANTKQPGFTMRNVLDATVKEGDISFERILMKDLPEEDDDLASWLQDLFRKKDELFDHYVTKGRFEGPHITLEPPLIGMIICSITIVIIWTVLGSWLFTHLWASTWVIRSIIFGLILTILIVLQLVLNITKAEKGSSYGSKGKSH